MPDSNNHIPFGSFGSDVKDARKALGYTQKYLAGTVGISMRYLANIENSGALPSLPVFYELVKVCILPVDRYFNPDLLKTRVSKARERTTRKLIKCPEKHLSIIERAIDAAIKIE